MLVCNEFNVVDDEVEGNDDRGIGKMLLLDDVGAGVDSTNTEKDSDGDDVAGDLESIFVLVVVFEKEGDPLLPKDREKEEEDPRPTLPPNLASKPACTFAGTDTLEWLSNF